MGWGARRRMNENGVGEEGWKSGWSGQFVVYGALTWRDQQLADNQATMEAAPRFHGLDPTVPLVWIGPLPTIFTYRHHTCTLIGCPPSPHLLRYLFRNLFVSTRVLLSSGSIFKLPTTCPRPRPGPAHLEESFSEIHITCSKEDCCENEDSNV